MSNHNVDLAFAKQAFDEILALCAPEAVGTWKPSTEQRAEYVRLAERSIGGVYRLQRLEQRRLFVEGQLHSVLPESHLAVLREQIGPRIDALHAAVDHLDPGGKEVRDLFFDLDRFSGAGGVRATFEEGLQQVYQLVERNPEWTDDNPFSLDTAYEVLESKLIQFEPDDWLTRSAELGVIRSDKRNFSLPGHVRMRLEELYRAYVFGLWLSTLGLSRAILEYAILDNLSKFKIDSTWPPDRDGRRREKKLSHLIDELGEHLPQYRESMTRLRDYGNEYLHPKKSQTSKESLLQRQRSAHQVIRMLVDVLEAIYLAPRTS